MTGCCSCAAPTSTSEPRPSRRGPAATGPSSPCRLDPRSGWSRLPDGELLPPGSLDLTLHDQGRRARHPSQALRDLLGAVDGERCRYPSCTRRRKLHAHHIMPLAQRRPYRPRQSHPLCARHHETVVHSEGFHLTLDPATRALTVTTAATAGPSPPPRTTLATRRNTSTPRQHQRRHPATRRRRQTPPALRRRDPHATGRLALLTGQREPNP